MFVDAIRWLATHLERPYLHLATRQHSQRQILGAQCETDGTVCCPRAEAAESTGFQCQREVRGSIASIGEVRSHQKARSAYEYLSLVQDQPRMHIYLSDSIWPVRSHSRPCQCKGLPASAAQDMHRDTGIDSTPRRRGSSGASGRERAPSRHITLRFSGGPRSGSPAATGCCAACFTPAARCRNPAN